MKLKIGDTVEFKDCRNKHGKRYYARIYSEWDGEKATFTKGLEVGIKEIVVRNPEWLNKI